MPARWAPASPAPRCATWRSAWHRWCGTARRSPTGYASRTAPGSSRGWWPRSASASGRATGVSGTRASWGCATTRRRRRWCGSPARLSRAMGFDQYHEPADELPEETRTFARLCASLTEEAEAIGWYQQRLALEADVEAAAIMRDAQGEEFKHFCMDLEFLLRRTPLWRGDARGVPFFGGGLLGDGGGAPGGGGGGGGA